MGVFLHIWNKMVTIMLSMTLLTENDIIIDINCNS